MSPGGSAAVRPVVGVDATPLLGPRTGIGRYVEHLVRELAVRVELGGVVAAAFTWRGREGLSAAVPASVRVAGRRAPARVLHGLWRRTELPPAEWLTGPLDVLHGTNFVLPPARHAAGIVTVHDLAYLHSPDVVGTASLRYRELVPRSLRRAALVLTPSRAVGAELAEAYRLPADRVLVTPLGVDPGWAAAKPAEATWLASRGLPPEYLLAVGALEPRKGLDVLVAAYAAVLADEPGAPPLVLAGPPGWGPGLDTAALPAGRLVLPGYLDEGSLRRVVAGARLLAFPSRYEGFGLPPLEAMAAGVPVVASDVAAVREVTAGLVRLVGVGQVEELAAALLAELRSPTPPEQLTAARDRALSHTWERCADLTVAAYTRVAGG